MKGLFLATKAVELERGPHAAFCFATGMQPELSGQSPVLYIGIHSRFAYEDVLHAADEFLMAVGPSTLESMAENQ